MSQASPTQPAVINLRRSLQLTFVLTQAAEGLCLLKYRDWRPSVSVLRIAVVLTDGMSNQESTTCMINGILGTVNSTAREIHNFVPPITVFAVGVSNYVREELDAIATDPLLVDVLSSFDYRLLAQNQRSESYFICFEGGRTAYLVH